MKTIKSFNNKFISSLLAFVVLLAGIFSFSPIKTKTASADMQDFVEKMLMEIHEYPMTVNICLIVDNKMIPNVQNGSRLSSVRSTSSFLQKLIPEIGATFNPNIVVDLGYYIFAQCASDTTKYVNLLTGQQFNFPVLLGEGVAHPSGSIFSIENAQFFGVMMWDTNQEIINYCKMYKDIGYMLSVFAKYDEETQPAPPMGLNELTVRYYSDSNPYLTDVIV